ncbi:MAG: hypothetical protein HIU86_01905 [Acidobacteria bacterium]|nr:hypothetical protein [Acidobacteriota bacterium]
MERDDAEDLRRRLYAPGASIADVERYRDLESPPPPGLVEPPSPPPPARPWRLLSLVAVAVVVLLVAVGIGVARATTAAQDAIPAPTPVRMSADDRQEIETNLADGNGAGIAAFLVTHRAPPALVGVRRAFTVERTGTGDGVAQIAPVTAETFRGHATVLIALEQSGEMEWTLYRRRIDPSGSQQLVLQRQRRGLQDAGALTTDTFRYASGDRPVEVHVQAPAGVRWGIAVVLSE